MTVRRKHGRIIILLYPCHHLFDSLLDMSAQVSNVDLSRCILKFISYCKNTNTSDNCNMYARLFCPLPRRGDRRSFDGRIATTPLVSNRAYNLLVIVFRALHDRTSAYIASLIMHVVRTASLPYLFNFSSSVSVQH